MTEDQAMHALGHLVYGTTGFTDKSINEYAAQFEKLDDAEALNDVCAEVARSWSDKWRPPLGEVMSRYYAHPRVRAEREERTAAAMLDEFAGRVVSFAEGMAIANDAYRSITRRNIGEAPVPNPDLAENLIVLKGRRDKDGNWVADYADVLQGFRGDQRATQVSLKALGRRLTGQGKLTLAPPDEPAGPLAARNPTPAPSGAPRSPLPSERPPDTSTLLSEAIGITIKRLGEGE